MPAALTDHTACHPGLGLLSCERLTIKLLLLVYY
jgi:hypothetical protein